ARGDRRRGRGALSLSSSIRPSAHRTVDRRRRQSYPYPDAWGPAIRHQIALLPVVKPDDGSVPKDAPMVDAVASQRVQDGTTAGTAIEPIRIGPSSSMKPLQLIGLTEAGTTKLLGQPAETEVSPQSRIWTYRSAACTLKIFFYPVAA